MSMSNTPNEVTYGKS